MVNERETRVSVIMSCMVLPLYIHKGKAIYTKGERALTSARHSRPRRRVGRCG